MKGYMRVLCLVLFAIVSLAVDMGAGAAVFFRNMDIRSGLSDNYVLDMALDRPGRVWIVTAKGVEVYDGHSIHNIALPKGINARKIVATASGRIFILTFGPVLRVTGRKAVVAADLPAGVDDIFTDSRLNPWFVTADSQIFRDSAKSFSISLKGIKPQAFVASADRPGVAYAIDSRRRLLEFNAYKRSSRTLLAVNGDFSRLYSAPGNILWAFGIPSRGLVRYDVSHSGEEGVGIREFDATLVSDVRRLADGRMAIATNSGGIVVTDGKGKPVERIVHDHSNLFSVPSNHVTKILSAADEMIVATGKKGIGIAPLMGADIRSIDLGVEEDICFFHEMPGGKLLAGTDGEGLVVLDYNDGCRKEKVFDMSNSSLTSNETVCHSTLPGGDLLVGTYGGGVYRFNGNRLDPFRADLDSLRYVSRIAVTADSSVWAGTFSKGLVLPGRLSFNHRNSSLSTSCITALISSGDSLIIGTSTGLCFMASPDGVPSAVQGSDELAGILVCALLKDSRGLIWLGSDNGLTIMDSHFRTISRLDSDNGLSDNMVRAIVEDREGNVWVTGNNGLTHVSVSREKRGFHFNATPFYESDGLGDITFNRHALTCLGNGDVLAGGLGRFLVIKSGFVPSRDIQSARVCITSVVIDGRPVEPGDTLPDGRVPVVDTFDNLREIRLRNGSRLEIEVSTLHFSTAAHTHYEYRLDNDTTWISLPDNRLILNNITAGNYKLEIRAQGSEYPCSLTLSVDRPLWLSWPALLLFVIFAALAVFLIAKIVARRQKAALSRQKLMETLDRQENAPLSADDIFLNKAKEQVDRHLSDETYGVEQLSNDMSMSRSNLYKRLSELTGKTPIEFIRLIRVREGKKMLDSGETSVSQTAYSIGLSPKQFSKYFREEYGRLPSIYLREKT